MKLIITGTTGMVGEGVLLTCLAHPRVEAVLSVSRRPVGIVHPRLSEYLVADFTALKPGDPKLAGYDACLYCAGVSSIGLKEDEFTRLTYDTVMGFAKALSPQAAMSLVYVSGAGTDGTEKGRTMWARVKGRTENDLMKLPFRQVFAFRPGFMQAVPGQQRLLKLYKYMAWLASVMKVVTPRWINTLEQVGNAMVEACEQGYEKRVVEVKDITALARRAEKLQG
ncbi:MAG: epimerase [Cyclobacteriaceae bacterium]|nr:epimerase [Cyclobacteriaceae bacterium]